MTNWKQTGLAIGLRWPFTEQDVADEIEFERQTAERRKNRKVVKEFLDTTEKYLDN